MADPEKPKRGLGALAVTPAATSSGMLGDYAGALADLLTQYPIRIEGKWYQNKRISLDGYHFVRCRFDQCRLVVTKGTFQIENCFFDKCDIEFNGEALRIAKLYNINSSEAWARGFLTVTPDFDPQTQTFTIKG